MGVYTSLGMIASQATISLGPVIGGYLNAASTDLALFRVATIIPFNLLSAAASDHDDGFCTLFEKFKKSSRS